MSGESKLSAKRRPSQVLGCGSSAQPPSRSPWTGAG
jgi:hypothetical protein